MFTIALTMQLKPGAYEGYRKAHDSLWPEIAASMRDNGVDMAIFRDGTQLFLFATAPDQAAWERSRQHPRLAEWDAAMTEFLVSESPGKIAFRGLEAAFGFGRFTPETTIPEKTA